MRKFNYDGLDIRCFDRNDIHIKTKTKYNNLGIDAKGYNREGVLKNKLAYEEYMKEQAERKEAKVNVKNNSKLKREDRYNSSESEAIKNQNSLKKKKSISKPKKLKKAKTTKVSSATPSYSDGNSTGPRKVIYDPRRRGIGLMG